MPARASSLAGAGTFCASLAGGERLGREDSARLGHRGGHWRDRIGVSLAAVRPAELDAPPGGPSGRVRPREVGLGALDFFLAPDDLALRCDRKRRGWVAGRSAVVDVKVVTLAI